MIASDVASPAGAPIVQSNQETDTGYKFVDASWNPGKKVSITQLDLGDM